MMVSQRQPPLLTVRAAGAATAAGAVTVRAMLALVLGCAMVVFTLGALTVRTGAVLGAMVRIAVVVGAAETVVVRGAATRVVRAVFSIFAVKSTTRDGAGFAGALAVATCVLPDRDGR